MGIDYDYVKYILKDEYYFNDFNDKKYNKISKDFWSYFQNLIVKRGVIGEDYQNLPPITPITELNESKIILKDFIIKPISEIKQDILSDSDDDTYEDEIKHVSKTIPTNIIKTDSKVEYLTNQNIIIDTKNIIVDSDEDSDDDIKPMPKTPDIKPVKTKSPKSPKKEKKTKSPKKKEIKPQEKQTEAIKEEEAEVESTTPTERKDFLALFNIKEVEEKYLIFVDKD